MGFQLCFGPEEAEEKGRRGRYAPDTFPPALGVSSKPQARTDTAVCMLKANHLGVIRTEQNIIEK